MMNGSRPLKTTVRSPLDCNLASEETEQRQNQVQSQVLEFFTKLDMYETGLDPSNPSHIKFYRRFYWFGSDARH